MKNLENKNNRLKEIAREMVWIQDEIRDNEKLRDYEEEELREHMKALQDEIMRNPALMNNIGMLEIYKHEYKQLNLGEYSKWIRE